MAVYRRIRSTRLLVATLIMLSLVTITVDYRGGQSGPFEAAGRATQTVVGALQTGVSRVIDPIGSFFSGLAHVGSLRSENERLQAKLRQMRQQQLQNTTQQRLVSEVLALVDLQRGLGLTGKTASVVGSSVSNFEWTITIDRGSSDEVKVGLPVVSGDGLVGHVIAVYPHTSVVQLILDPESAVAGRLTGSGATGLVTGNRNQPLQMQLVNPDATVTPGEQVVTAGYQNGLYPPEIPIGAVSYVYVYSGGLSKIIAIRPAVDFSSLEIVLVVTGS